MNEVSENGRWERDEERYGDLLEVWQQDEWIFRIIEDQREDWIRERAEIRKRE